MNNQTEKTKAIQADFNEFLETLAARVDRLPPVKLSIQTKNIKGKERATLAIQFGDPHAGNEPTGVLKRRINNYIKDIIIFVKKTTLIYQYDEVIVNVLGDLVEGEEIYQGQRYEILYNLWEQITISSEFFNFFIRELRAFFPSDTPIKVKVIPGNHGRFNLEKHSKTINADIIAMTISKAYCESNFKNVEFEITTDELLTYKMKGNTILITHGGGKNKLLIPAQDLTPAAQSKLLRLIMTTNADAIICGHGHNQKILRLQNTPIYINGRFGAITSLEKDRLSFNTRSTQFLLVVPESGLECGIYHTVQIKTS